MVRLSELRKSAIKLMSENNIKEARADTDFLLFFFTGADKKDILLGDKGIPENEETKFKDAVKRRIAGEPVQYITGETEFMSLKFKVNNSTLIPRADTEVLIEKCIELINKNNLKTVLDIGTGSGCIGLSLGVYCKDISVTLLDVSEDALKVAKSNAKKLGIMDRVRFLSKDILKEDIECYDLVVSNPPYIESDEVKKLEEKVKNFEPQSALDGGDDGLRFYRRITSVAAKKADFLAFEIGYNQKETVSKIMSEYFCGIEFIKDYGGNPRVLIGKNKQR